MALLIGVIAGIISGAGFGGGTILILFLSIFLGIDQHIAQATNIIFFIPTAIAATIVNLKQKSINVKDCTIVTIFGVIGAIIGATMATKILGNQLKKYFGIFLIFIAICEIYSFYCMYKKRENSYTINNNREKGGHR